MDRAEAIKTVMGLLSIEGQSGKELAVADFVRRELMRAGVDKRRIFLDKAHLNMPFEAECGNLIVEIPGKGRLMKERPRLFCAHMDTVSLAAGAEPVRRGGRILPKGETALGADDRAGVAVLVVLAKTLFEECQEHAPIVLVFTVCEEIGLWGSRYLPAKVLKRCAMGFSYDGSDPAELIVAAPSSDRYAIEIKGLAAHAGQHPEKGISAAVVFARAVANLQKKGWLGCISKGRQSGTSNIGVVSGGLATNIVMPCMKVEGEARSHSDAFLKEIGEAFKCEFVEAAERTRNASGRNARVRFKRERIYSAFELSEDSLPVQLAVRAMGELGLRVRLRRQFGGLDANWLNAKGLPTVTLGTGAHSPHDLRENLDIKEFLTACQVALGLATLPCE